jgi:hypothetical protein
MNLPKMEITCGVFIEKLIVIQLLKICKVEIHHCVHKDMPLDAVLNQLNPKHIFRVC